MEHNSNLYKFKLIVNGHYQPHWYHEDLLEIVMDIVTYCSIGDKVVIKGKNSRPNANWYIIAEGLWPATFTRSERAPVGHYPFATDLPRKQS